MNPSSHGRNITEIHAVYEKMIEVLLYFGPIEKLDEIVHPDFHGYGTAAHEFLSDKAALKRMAKMQAEQLKGTEYTLTRKIIFEKFLSDGKNYLILEDFELHLQDNDHNLPLRLSTILEKVSGKWLITHFHGSTPDSDIAEEEALPMEGLRKKNEELEAKIRERTRELEIEAALERVRSASMAIHKSEELHKVVLTVAQEINSLGLNIDAAHLFRFEEGNDKGFNMWIAGDGGVYPNEVYFPYIKHEIFDGIYNARQKNKSFFSIAGMSKKVKNRVYRHLLKSANINISESRQKYALGTKSGAYSIALSKNSGIAIIKFSEEGAGFGEEEHEILRRFSNVFEQAYIRFLGLANAEKQAREAQIQLALERVRARSLAMQSSDELHEVLGVLFRQFDDLGIQPVNVFLSLFDREQRTLTYRASGKSGKRMPGKQVVEVDSMEALRALYDKWLTDNSDTVEVIFFPKEVLSQLFGIFSETFSSMPKEDRMGPEDFPEGGYSMAGYTPFGYLGYDHQRPATDEEKEILIRFCVEFTRVYQRFLDIQKAEAQTREAQIEMALERVRSASMAMHKSKDLHDVLVMLYNQLASLGLKMHSAQIIESIDDPKEMHIWIVTNGVVYSEQVHAPFSKNIFFKRFREAVTNGESFYTLKFSKRQKDNLFHHFFDNTILRNAPQARKDLIFSSPGLGTSNAMGKYTSLSVMRYDGILYSEEENEIIKRFAKVLEQSYTRFLDIKKAEAHAREAQIEAALERIRSKAMAMHSSDDLADTVEILYKELDTLQVHALRFGHAKLNADTKIVELHTATDLGKVVGQIKLEGHPLLEKIYKNFLAKEDLYYALQGEEMKSYYSILGRAIDVPIPPMDTVQHGYFFFLKDTANYAWSDKALDEEELKIYRRLITVLNLTYKRYEELKNAETQAREAQIEAALEKVRSQSLAMHNTSEMQLVANAVFEQLQALGMEMDVVGMSGIIEAKQDYDVWIGGAPLGSALRIPYNEDTQVQRDYNKMLKDRPELFVRTYSGQVKKEYIDRLLTHGEFPEALKKKMKTSDAFTTMIAPKKNSGIQVVHYSDQPYTDQDAETLKRFAGVFEQAYIRFMDLEKAEAQAREAEIDLAIERIRSQAMAMKESSELLDIVVTMRSEFIRLGHEAHYFWHMMWLPDKYEKAMTSGDGKRIGMVMELPRHLHGDIKLLANWEKSKKPLVVYPMDAEAAIDYVDKMINLGDFKQVDPNAPSHDDIRHIGGLTFIMARTTHGEIGYSLPGVVEQPPEEDLFILQRFAGAFDLAHRRFLDLKKSEAQAREVEIELALERVRARTMAMQHSDELQEASFLLDEQVRKLGIQTWGCAFNIYREKDSIEWFGNEKGILPTYTVPRKGIFKKYYDLGQKGSQLHIQEFKGAKCIAHYEYMSTLPVIGDVLKQLKKTNGAYPEYQIDHVVYFKYGYLLFITTEQVPDSHDIFKRFAQVFEQTYTRFLDLQKAEAQAREAKIETALEKVRSCSLAMHSTTEMQEVANEVYEQLQNLGLELDAVGMSGVIEAKNDYDVWIGGSTFGQALRIPFNEDTEVQRDYNKAIAERVKLFARTYSGKEKEEYTKHLLKHGEFPGPLKKKMKTAPAFSTSISFSKYSSIQIARYTDEPYSKEENEILQRFSRVFEQAYIRFMDLEKAEAQAREAQIEAALEKVRSRTMAMQRSEELPEAANTLFLQIQSLGIPAWSAGYCIWESEDKKFASCNMSSEGELQKSFSLPTIGEGYNFYDPIKKGDTFYVEELGGEKLVKHYEFMRTLPTVGEILDELLNAGLSLPTFQIFHILYFPQGYLMFITYEPVPKAHPIFKRFAKVFEQTYTRFLDLQKAEAQAREAQIEAALERIRAKSMAMHSSDELSDVLEVLFEQFVILEINPVFAVLNLYDLENDTFTMRVTGKNGAKVIGTQTVKFSENEIWKDYGEKFRQGTPDMISDQFYPAEILPDVWEILKDLVHAVPEKVRPLPSDFPDGLYNIEGYCTYGTIGCNLNRPPTEEEKNIVIKFATEFGRLYQRFLDIQKAEAQARESQIEAALERVRSRSMAMHKSSEMLDLIKVVSDQLRGLNLNFDSVSFAKNDVEGAFTFWLSSKGQPQPILMEVPPIDSRVMNSVYSAKKNGLRFITDVFSAAENKEWSKHLIRYTQLKQYPETIKEFILTASGFARSSFFLKNIDLYVVNYKAIPFTEAENSIFGRFAQVFEQAYTRFLDLQKAEFQAREAQIEAALERVRSKTMAMHNSQDVGATVVTLFDEVKNLNLEDSIRCGIGILEGNEKMETWSANATPGGKVELKLGMLDMTIHPMLVGVKNSWKRGKKGYTYELKDGDVRNYYSKLNAEPEYSFTVDLDTLPDKIYHKSFVFSAGILFAFTENAISEEGSKVLERFAGVFGQTYRRYLDLLNAEKQAREAQIEASLERIRARAMAMHHTDELTDVLGVLFDQFDSLGINPVLTHLTLFDEENETFTLRITTGGKKRVIAEQLIDVNAVESWKTSFANWKKSEMHAIDFIEYPPEVLPAVWELLDEVMSALPEENKIYPEDFPDGLYTTQGHCKYGYIGFNHNRRATEEEKDIVIRFAKEFGRLYQRFLDIQKAELQARDALKQATLDRVRGQIASMRSASDLERITPLIWNELTFLEIPFIRCGVFIINESNKTVQAFLSAPDGHSLGAMQIPFKADKVTAAIVAHWKKGEVFRTHWDKKQFLEFMQLMVDLGQVSNKNEYQGAEQPPESLHLHFVPFTQGMLYVGNTESLEEEQIELVKTLADAFAIAYARYEDFVKLEKAKERVENTLEELKATQNQLVQSEKMASLGELTAGIAHEIQNPLNFVNNFSEVSVELLEEMQEEMDKGDLEEVKALLDDIKQNLDKIAHHGKRADGIVKGMLQHSRASSGEKELTDINILADEYLRLAYHGLRAKDKSFNATLETDFDESIGKVNVLAQDLGRVILNLITNAFYVVKEKSSHAKASEDSNYMPTVTVSTKKSKAGVEIRVKDNGNGIPDEIKEKIFEPFFTTKPTGQGTGLGLSMSYDIVTKGHGGELKVDTKKGQGTTFLIFIPFEAKNH